MQDGPGGSNETILYRFGERLCYPGRKMNQLGAPCLDFQTWGFANPRENLRSSRIKRFTWNQTAAQLRHSCSLGPVTY
jgi:hypothetical protein